MACPTIKGRGTSVTSAFVHAIVPRQDDLGARRELFERLGIDMEACVYCGDRRTDWDHLRPLVKGARSSGHFHTVHNLVPACGPCNQSRSGQDWRQWIAKSLTKESHRLQGVRDLDARKRKLCAFEAEADPLARADPDELRDVVGAKSWDQYWALLDDIKRALEAADGHTQEIREKLESWMRNRTLKGGTKPP